VIHGYSGGDPPYSRYLQMRSAKQMRAESLLPLLAFFLQYGCSSTKPHEQTEVSVTRDQVSYSTSVQRRDDSIAVRLRMTNRRGEATEIIFPGKCRFALILYPVGGDQPIWDGRESVGCPDFATPIRLSPGVPVTIQDLIPIRILDGAGRPLEPSQYRAAVWVYVGNGLPIDIGIVDFR
jgi:hypothetical protein